MLTGLPVYPRCPLPFALSLAAGRSSDLTLGFLIAIVLDIIVIPWTYVFAHYIKKPGDRWR